ncbi:MAG: hypothetical protein JW811_09610 [Clostridiales bacterium]|nr:hypothetical protein [Clostridiales bacterium]
MLKKALITLAVLAVLTGAVLLIRHVNMNRETQTVFAPVQEDEIANDSLVRLDGSGYKLVQENELLELYVSFDDGNIRVVNKENGFVWRSCPTEEEMALDKSNALWKNNLQSAVMCAYTVSESSTDLKYLNPLAQETLVTVFEMKTGVRVYFEFLEPAVTFAYDIALQDDHLIVDIPSYLISDPGEIYNVSSTGKRTLDKKTSCLIVDMYLFPSLGATRSDMGNTGCLLVPDGSGALMDFQSDKYVNSQFIGHVYGADWALYNGYDQQLQAEFNKPAIRYPVYGVVRDGNTMLAVIDRGETQADIVASKAYVQTGFNSVNSRFNYRMKYKVVTNSATGDGYLRYTTEGLEDVRRLMYYFGTGDYVDMAQTYRGYLMETYDLHQIQDAEALPLQLNIVGGDEESGLVGASFIPMTTFEQAKEILQYFKDNGIESVDAVCFGWAKRGESVEYPDRFPAAAGLGGDSGLTSLAGFANELGMDLYLDDDNMTLDSHKGVSVRRDAVYNIQNNPLFNGWFANAGRIAATFNQSLETYRGYGISGIQEYMVGWLLLTDYSRISPTTREQMKQAQRDLLIQMKEEFSSLLIDSSNSYVLMDDITLTSLAGGSYLTILDESVPFYTIALHGLVDYLCGDYMRFYEPWKQVLDTVALGGNMSFSVSWEPTEDLKYSDSSWYYSTEFSLWKEDIVAMYQRMRDYSEKTRASFITGYTKLTADVVLTTYDNGARVLVNYADEAYDYLGIIVPARDFAVVEGGEDGA